MLANHENKGAALNLMVNGPTIVKLGRLCKANKYGNMLKVMLGARLAVALHFGTKLTTFPSLIVTVPEWFTQYHID